MHLTHPSLFVLMAASTAPNLIEEETSLKVKEKKSVMLLLWINKISSNYGSLRKLFKQK